MANKPNIPNIPNNSAKNVPPAVPQNKKQAPNIPGSATTNPIKPDLSEISTDANKWLLVTGDFSKDNNLISWLEKKDIESHSTSLETCTLLSLTRKIQELKPGDSNTYIALLPPDKPELIYLYGGSRRYDLYYYTFDFVYRLTDMEVDEWKETAFNYFSKSLLPDFTDSYFIETGKTKEIHERWEDKFPEEFLDKVLKNIYLFVSPEETEYKIFQFLDNMLDSEDDDIDLDIDDLVDEDEIKENLDALVKDGLELSASQEAVLDEIANDMLKILKQSPQKEAQQDFAEIHERWDDKLPKEFIDKVLKNINLFVSPEETEYKIFQFLDNMLDSDDDIDLDIDDLVDEDEVKENLDALVKDGLELSASQEAALDEIANDMLQILKQSQKKEVHQDLAEIHERWDAKLPKEFIDKILEKISPYCSVEEIENTIFSYWYNWLNSDEDDLTKYLKYKDDVTENKDDVTFFKRKKLDDLEYKRAHKNDSPEAKNAWKQAVEDVKDIDKAIRGGANTLGDLKLAVKHNLSLSQELEDLFLDNKNTEIDIHGINGLVFQRMIKLFTGILLSQLTPKEKIIILDELRPDIQQPLADQFIRVRTERKHQQQAKTALKDVERVAKPNAETIVKADDNRKQQAKTTLKDAEPDTKKKRVVEARKDNVEARQAKAAQNRKQMVAEKETNEIKKGKGKWGCISIIAIFIIYSLIPSSMKSCHKESESEDYVEEVSDVTYDNDGGNFDNLDVSSVEEMLEKKFDYVSKYDNYFEIRKKSKYGIADLRGNIKIKPQYDYISSPDEDLGIIEVRKEGKYGMVSLKTLTEIVVPTYDYIGSYNEDTDLFEVRKDGKYGLFSPQKRKEVAPCEYSYIAYDGGLYRVRKDGKNGYLNSDGSLVKPLQ